MKHRGRFRREEGEPSLRCYVCGDWPDGGPYVQIDLDGSGFNWNICALCVLKAAAVLTGDAVPLGVDCHTCHADAGEPCRWSPGPEGYHKTRILKFKAQINETR